MRLWVSGRVSVGNGWVRYLRLAAGKCPRQCRRKNRSSDRLFAKDEVVALHRVGDVRFIHNAAQDLGGQHDNRALGILEHVARSCAEPGCLEHGVAVDANDGLRLVFFERWADRESLLAHFRVPASREFAKQVAQLAAHPPELATYDASELALR